MHRTNPMTLQEKKKKIASRNHPRNGNHIKESDADLSRKGGVLNPQTNAFFVGEKGTGQNNSQWKRKLLYT